MTLKSHLWPVHKMLIFGSLSWLPRANSSINPIGVELGTGSALSCQCLEIHQGQYFDITINSSWLVVWNIFIFPNSWDDDPI